MRKDTLELSNGLLMIIDLWDCGLTDDIEDYIEKFNAKTDIEEAKIQYKEDEFGEKELPMIERMYLAREIANKLLHNPQ